MTTGQLYVFYALLTDEDAVALQTKVNERLSAGWKLHGPTFAVGTSYQNSHGLAGVIIYGQAVICEVQRDRPQG